MNAYTEHQREVKKGLLERAERVQGKADKLWEEEKNMLSVIPFGQPILVGHHSEGAHRNLLKRARRKADHALEVTDEASRLKWAAKSDRVAISSNDKNAVAKLEGKLEVLEETREAIKAQPHQRYQLANIGATIRNTKKRIEELKKAATMETRPDIQGAGFVVHEDREDNRIHVVFDERPPRETCQEMRSYGFRWSPSRGAWVRMLNNNGRFSVNQLVALFDERQREV